MASELEQDLIVAGYTADQAAGIEAAIAAACGMLGVSEAQCAELRTAAGLVGTTGEITAETAEVFGRVVPVSRAMLHRHFKLSDDEFAQKVAAGPVPISKDLAVGWFAAILRSTKPATVPQPKV